MKKLLKNWNQSEGCLMESEYYIVFMNPHLHKKTWNTIRLVLTVAEIKYILFYDYDIQLMELHPVSKHEFRDFNYNAN
jgi:hypothetical protein